MEKNRKKIVKSKFRKGLIPEDLLEEINNDIDTYLTEKSKENEKKIEEMIITRINLGMDIRFSEQYIRQKLSYIYSL